MPRRRGLSYAAAIGCVAGAILLAAAVGQVLAQSPAAPVSAGPQQDAHEHSPNPVAAPAAAAEREAKNRDQQSAQKECADEETGCIAKQDLLEQRRMADAAQKQVDLIAVQTNYIWWQNLGNFIQGGLLFLTLAATAGAAIASAIAAKAANKSVKALADIERAYVFFHPIGDNFREAIFSDHARSWLKGQKSLSPPPKPRIKIRFRNLGRTPASIVEIRIGLHNVPGGPSPEDWAIHSAASLREPVFAPPPADPFDMDITHKQGLAVGDFDLLDTKANSYFIHGRVVYWTVIDDRTCDKPRETTFCWRYNFRKKYWREHGGPAYNKHT